MASRWVTDLLHNLKGGKGGSHFPQYLCSVLLCLLSCFLISLFYYLSFLFSCFFSAYMLISRSLVFLLSLFISPPFFPPHFSFLLSLIHPGSQHFYFWGMTCHFWYIVDETGQSGSINCSSTSGGNALKNNFAPILKRSYTFNKALCRRQTLDPTTDWGTLFSSERIMSIT